MTTSPSNNSICIVKPEVLDRKKILLTSPLLHIGSAVSKLNPFEYVQTDQRIYYPNRDILEIALKQRGKLQDYITRIENRSEIVSLLEDTFGDDWQTATTTEGESIFLSSILKRTEERVTDLRPMIRNGFGQLYIPGSSIKGAIRTAIAYHLIKNAERYHVPQQQQVSEIEARIRQNMGDIRQRAKKFDDRIFMDDLFANFGLTYQGNSIKVKEDPNPNTDIMRAVCVSDTKPILETTAKTKQGQTVPINQPIVTEVIVSSHQKDFKAKYRASIFVEMVRNVQAKFEISLDCEMLSWFRHRQGMQIPFTSVDDILNICQDFGQEQWDAEYDYWQDVKNNSNAKDNNGQSINLEFSNVRSFYEKEQCPYSLRLGWASGMTGTTLGLLLEDELRSQIRDNCGINAPGFAAPKSRRTATIPGREIKFVPSWAKFKAL
jgi:CRISPR-associated protein Csm5